MNRRIRLLALVTLGYRPSGVPKAGPAYDVATGDAAWFRDNIPCQAACPAHTDISRYIALIADGRYADSYELNREANVLPGCLGRVCARPCEDACRRRYVDAPVSICALKRVAADAPRWATSEQPPLPSGRRVAIVGAGPAGLAAARELARKGHAVTVYDRYPVPGGMLWAGIPAWRLPRDVVRREVEQITALGVELRLGVDVGPDLPLVALIERHDAVLVATGCRDTSTLAIPGEDLSGVIGGLRFLEAANLTGAARFGADARVLTIGGGYTSIDCVRSARRLGARQVMLAYRRGRADIPVSEEELVEAEREGVAFTFGVSPVRIVGEGGRARGVEFVRNRVTTRGDGRPAVEPIPGSDFVIPADYVIVAIGQRANHALDPEGLLGQPDRKGALPVGADFRTRHPRVWATGDYVAGPRNVISAIADGKAAASAIDAALSGSEVKSAPEEAELTSLTQPELPLLRRLLQEGVADWSLSTPDRRVRRGDDYTSVRRRPMPLLPMTRRGLGTGTAAAPEVELGIGPEAGGIEAQRCLQCQLNIFIDGTQCILCNGCVEVCPYDCIEMVPIQRVRSVDGDPELPETAAKTLGNHAVAMVIDEERCIRCGRCVDRCPTGCLTMDHFRPAPAREVVAAGHHRR